MPQGLVLVVDDCPEDASVMATILRRVDPALEVATCEGGREALEWLATRVPDLVLLDLRMPVVDGLDVLQHIQADARLCHVPVVIVAGSPAPRDPDTCRRAGAAAFCVKPMHLHQLTAVLAGVVRRWLRRAA